MPIFGTLYVTIQTFLAKLLHYANIFIAWTSIFKSQSNVSFKMHASFKVKDSNLCRRGSTKYTRESLKQRWYVWHNSTKRYALVKIDFVDRLLILLIGDLRVRMKRLSLCSYSITGSSMLNDANFVSKAQHQIR